MIAIEVIHLWGITSASRRLITKKSTLDYHPVNQFFQNAVLLSGIQAQGTTILVVVLIVSLFLSFVLSGSEVAFFSLTYKDVNMLKSKQQLAYLRIVKLLEEPKILLGSLLIANSFINISIISFDFYKTYIFFYVPKRFLHLK